jgi:hypothetical protein
MVSDGTAPYHAVYSIHERHHTMNPSSLLFSIDTLLQLESYVKLVEAINRAKDMKPLVSMPTGVIYNPAYWTD